MQNTYLNSAAWLSFPPDIKDKECIEKGRSIGFN